MARKKKLGKTASGKPLTEEMVEKLARKAEAGYDIEETLRRRLDDPRSVRRRHRSSRCALAKRADRDDETTSAAIRKALRRHLRVG